jgi:hypothetical protein
MNSFPLFASIVILTFQPDNAPSLIAAETIWGKDGALNKINLVRIALAKDALRKDVVLQADAQAFGNKFVTRMFIKDRYIVTGAGGVIDIQTRKIIHDQRHGTLLGVDAGKVIYLLENTNVAPNDFFIFDLDSHKVQRLDNPGHWKFTGVRSPNKKMSIRQDNSGGPILLHHLDGTVDQLGEGHRVTYARAASPHRGGLPFVWLDDERVLTQRGNGEFVMLDIKGKEAKLLTIEGEAKGTLGPPSLYRDELDRIIYRANHRYVIDVKAKSATRLSRSSLGHSFEIATEPDDKQLTGIFHANKEIGRRYFVTYGARTAPGLIAIAYAEPGQSLGYPKGIAVWQAKSGRWRSIDLNVNDVIGWAK